MDFIKTLFIGLSAEALDCGDFLRGALSSLSYIRDSFRLSLQWKYECAGCNRFSVANMADDVLRLDATAGGDSLQTLLEGFLLKRKCVCGHVSKVEPEVKRAGKWVFVELDRASVTEDDSKELVLYSLQLKEVRVCCL